ncbi:MAG: hypothetical protein HS117_10760 [Verrucomicrobiaceae bacterium]|nr:hypothetical protein [Verrucomicrobiaceae bacterium]
MKSGPLLFLAGAAAAGWIASRRRQQRPLELLPPRAQPEPASSEAIQPVPQAVEGWLARQIAREETAPVITLDLLSPAPAPEVAAPPPLEMDFPPIGAEAVPAEELIDPPLEEPWSTMAEEPRLAPGVAPGQASVPVYGLRGETAPSSPPVVTHQVDDWPGNPGAWAPRESFQAPVVSMTPAAVEDGSGKDAAWLLGIEPLPSWDEPDDGTAAVAPDTASLVPAFVEEAPSPSVEEQSVPEAPAAVPAQPLFVPPLFQGAVLPDQIDVSQGSPPPVSSRIEVPWTTAPEEPVLPPVSLLDAPFLSPQPVDEAPSAPFPPAPVESSVAETPPPLRAMFFPAPQAVESPPAPWVGEDLAVPVPSAAESPAADAAALAPEIEVTLAAPGEATFDDPLAGIAGLDAPAPVPAPPPLRPLAPVVEAEVIVRPRGLPPASIVARSPGGSMQDTTPEEAAGPLPPELPPAPVVLPREQRARKTWRSWWRGE